MAAIIHSPEPNMYQFVKKSRKYFHVQLKSSVLSRANLSKTLPPARNIHCTIAPHINLSMMIIIKMSVNYSCNDCIPEYV